MLQIKFFYQKSPQYHKYLFAFIVIYMHYYRQNIQCVTKCWHSNNESGHGNNLRINVKKVLYKKYPWKPQKHYSISSHGNSSSSYQMERMILLKYLKIQLDTDLKIILLNHQNNCTIFKLLLESRNFFATLSSYLNNYFYSTKFSNLHLTKFLDIKILFVINSCL